MVFLNKCTQEDEEGRKSLIAECTESGQTLWLEENCKYEGILFPLLQSNSTRAVFTFV